MIRQTLIGFHSLIVILTAGCLVEPEEAPSRRRDRNEAPSGVGEGEGEGEGDGEGADGRQHTTLSASGGMVCALLPAGAIRCWGEFQAYDDVVPPAGDLYAQVSAGADHACALRKDGTVTCWGKNDQGQSDAPDGLFKTVAAGLNQSCGLRLDNSLTCWGLSDFPAPPTTGDYVELEMGTSSSCALDERREATCWGTPGDDEYFVNGDFIAIQAPAEAYHGLSVANDYACALRVDDSIRCWGTDQYIESGETPSAGTFIQVSVGGLHACALDTAGRVTCWGTNTFEQLNVPADIQGQVLSIGAAGLGVCAVVSADPDDVEADEVVCWGETSTTFNLPADL